MKLVKINGIYADNLSLVLFITRIELLNVVLGVLDYDLMGLAV